MKSFLNKGLFVLLFSTMALKAEPIQLIPKPQQPIITTELPSPIALGFWEGTPPSVIETYLPKVPVRLTSRTLRKLRAELLKEKYTPLLKNVTYQTTLYSLLTETGQFSEAKDFLVDSDLEEKDARLIDLQWMEGETRKACDKIANLVRTTPSLALKQQNIYCLYLNGEEVRGKVAAELLKESIPNDMLMNALFDASLKPPFDSIIAGSPFFLSVWASLGQDMSEESLKTLSPAGLSTIARSPKMPFKTRLTAAYMAWEEGLVNATDDLSASLKEGKMDSVEKAHQENKLAFYLSVLKPKIDPSPETLGLAPIMVRAYLQNGEKDLAKKWSSFLMRESPEEAAGLLPLLHLAYPETKWGEQQLQAWQGYQARIHPKQATERLNELKEILAALGETPGLTLKWNGDKLLDAAVVSKRKGEVLLLTLVNMGGTPLKDIPTEKFIGLLTALHKACFEADARELALEYLLSKEF